jgi:nitrous oxidase accessory protein NosD
MKVKMTLPVLALAALALALPASSAAGGSRVVHVDTGESIQAAIDAARPYTTIKIEAGTYAESLVIDKDGIELAGEGRKKTKIVPPASPTAGEGCVFPADGGALIANGICVTHLNEQGEIVHRVEDVHISHLSVSGFNGNGIFYLGTEDGVVTRVIAADNEEYGIFANDSSGTKITRNVASNDLPDVNPAPGIQLPEAGIYVGDSPDADATVWKNVAYGQLLGILIRDASDGDVVKNKMFSNCVGILILNTGAPVDTGDWLAKHNNVTANNRRCDSFEGGEAPALSGVGIAVLGGHDIDLIDNGVFGNKTAEGFESAFGGGIVVLASPFVGPEPVPSTGIKVAFNTAIGNDPDLFWDEQGSGNSFFQNDCLTSQPDGLCEDPDHDGDHGDDDHGDKDDDRGNGHKGDRHDDRAKKHKSSKHRKHKKHKKGKKSKRHDRDDD